MQAVAVSGASRAVGALLRQWLEAVLFAAPAAEPATEVAAEVLERACGGHPEAFAELVRHYDRRLRALAFRLLGDEARMDDALQEAYVKAFRALPGFKRQSNVGTWLYRITYNVCLDELRRGKRTLRLFSPEPEDAPATGPGPADVAVARHDLAAALANLPPDQRAVVLLVDAEGLDYAQAGEVLGVGPGTVASRLSRARAQLRRALEVWDR